MKFDTKLPDIKRGYLANINYTGCTMNRRTINEVVNESLLNKYHLSGTKDFKS